MDKATISGILLGFGLIVVTLLLGEGLIAFVDIPGLVVVLGGTLAATLVTFPMNVVTSTFKVAGNAFSEKVSSPRKMIIEITKLAEMARKDSVLALEKARVKNSFLKKGIRLLVDGKSPAAVQEFLFTELTNLKDRHRLGKEVFDAMGELSPAFGMIGTLIGLVQMLQTLSNPSAIGPAMSVALLTTFYGAVLANLVFIPIAKKLELRSRQESILNKVIIEGVVAIGKQENPRAIKDKLETFLGPKERSKVKK